MRDALSLLDQAIAYAGGKVTESAVRAMLGAIDDDLTLFKMLDGLARSDATAVLAVADDMESRSLSFDGALQDLAALLHRLALAQIAPDALPARQRSAASASASSPGAVARCRRRCSCTTRLRLHGRQDLPLAPDEYAGFTMALMRMLAFRPMSRCRMPEARRRRRAWSPVAAIDAQAPQARGRRRAVAQARPAGSGIRWRLAGARQCSSR